MNLIDKTLAKWIIFWFGCTLVFNVTSTYSQTIQKPNVILIITDDQGYGDLGFHGNEIIQTPHLDNLFQESVRATNFHASPTCTPTRGVVDDRAVFEPRGHLAYHCRALAAI
ncbi:MAG: sulfatase-like hydrolase/transferase [Balneolaceae bacterium]|nr:sulfatase-like hydrolase/transferase [Balneolaceae bacterium]